MTTTETAIAIASASSVTDLPALVMDAWARHDGRAFARLFTEEGSMVLPGVAVHGRDRIAAFMDEAFAGTYRGTQVKGEPVGLRQIADDVVLMMTEGGVAPDAESDVPADSRVRASWLAVRQDGGWLLAAYQNTPRG